MTGSKITSKDNPKIKHLKKLSKKKYREEFGEFFVENLNIIRDAVVSGHKPISIFATEDFVRDNESELANILKRSELKVWFEIDNKSNKEFSNLKKPSGITAVYEIPKGRDLDTKKPIIYLNSIGDTGNLGTILRSALAFNLKTIVLDETCADPYNYKAINAAKDSIFKVKIVFDKDLETLKKIKKKMKIVATRIYEAKELKDLDKSKPFCLILGDESRGVDDKIQKLSDEFIFIKTVGEIESLNVASAAAIIFHNIYSEK